MDEFVCVCCGCPVRRVPVRADVICDECLSMEACINCRRIFADDESKSLYVAYGRSVGPFCGPCDKVIAVGCDSARAVNR